MLNIITDISEFNWLNYIFEEFLRINGGDFTFNIYHINNQPKSSNSNPVIFYTQQPQSTKISIPNKSNIAPSISTSYITKDLFVFKNTLTNNTRFSLNYDILWNAFLILSRYEEYYAKNTISSYVSRHPREDKDSFLIPIVNNYFNTLQKLLEDNFPNLHFNNKPKYKVELSHDVDYIKKTSQLLIKQSAFNFFNTLKSIFKPKVFLINSKKSLKYLINYPIYWCFDYWIELEKKFNMNSVFYFYFQTKPKTIKQWLLDPSYNIRNNKKLINKIKELKKNGFEVGLHGSFNSAEDIKLLKKEKEGLENTINFKIDKIRQHWLRYNEKVTPYLHEKLFKCDSTIGWNDIIGFRSGCLSKYRPYDHINKKPFKHFIIPQVIMDSNIFDYGKNKQFDIQKKCINLISLLNSYKNVYISISWHQRVCSNDYNWHFFYEKILNEYIQRNIKK